jgi:hypothetical protein
VSQESSIDFLVFPCAAGAWLKATGQRLRADRRVIGSAAK